MMSMHRLFTIEDLVDEICSHVPHSQLPVLARVSSTWFRCAASHMYKDVNILAALSPLGNMTNKKSDNPPSDEAFKRLLKYTPYVQNLFMDANFVSITLEEMQKKCSEEGIPYLFPNTRFLGWSEPVYSPECIEVATCLISPRIEEFAFCTEDWYMLRYLCSLIVTRLSALRFILIDCTAYFRDDSSFTMPVQDLLTAFAHTLTSVYIPLSFSTPSIVTCLSKLPNLCNLTIGRVSTEQLEGSEICEDHDSAARGFPSLRSFSYEDDLESFYDMFLSPYSFTSLTIFSLAVDSFTPDDVRILLSYIVATCPRIRSLVLGKEEYNHDLDEQLSTYVWPVVPWEFVRPLSNCKELTSLSLYFVHVSVRLEELTEFLKSRTTWTSLHMSTSDPLRLQDVLIYPKYCPNLEHLGIHITIPDKFCAQDLPDDLPTFSIITSINFTCSNITKSNTHSLTQFLCRICKKPPSQFNGIFNNIDIDDIFKSLAVSYLDENYRTGSPMSSEVLELVKKNGGIVYHS